MIPQHRANFLSGAVFGVVVGMSLGHVTVWRRPSSTSAAPVTFPVMHPGTPFEYSLGPRTAALPLPDGEGSMLTELLDDGEPDPLVSESPLQNAIAISRDEQESRGGGPNAVPPAVDEPQPLTVETAQPIPQRNPLPAAARNDEDIVRALVDAELADLPQQQREVWYDALKGETREDAAGILRMWKLFGGPLPTALGQDATAKPTVSQPESPGFAAVPNPAGLDVLEAAKEVRRLNMTMAFTPGYQRRVPYFVDRLQPDGTSATQLRTTVDFNSTMVIQTGFPLDLSIHGPGFFQVTDEAGDVFLTRLGRFTLNADRELVLLDGDRQLRLTPTVSVPEKITELGIHPDGQVQYAYADDPSTKVNNGDRISLTLPLSPEHLESLPNGLFRLPAEHQGKVLTPASSGAVLQGSLEFPKIDIDAERNSIRLLDELR